MDKKEIQEKMEQGMSQAAIARKKGVSKQYIGQILHTDTSERERKSDEEMKTREREITVQERYDRIDMRITDPEALTAREQVFADRILAGDTQTHAAIVAYERRPETAGSKATQVMRRERVIAYLSRQARGAAERIVLLSKTAESESVRLDANQDILDRANVGPDAAPLVNITLPTPILGSASIEK